MTFLGNTRPTVTDANVVLGRLGTSLAGGQIGLDATKAKDAVQSGVAQPLGLDVDEAALSIVSVANANMADAVRLISITLCLIRVSRRSWNRLDCEYALPPL